MQQQILAAYPAADLAVYVIWMPMLPTDARDTWDSHLLADRRVTHLWDRERTLSRWLADGQKLELGSSGDIVWDAFLLFGPEATWESTPSDLLAWGGPIVGRFPELEDALTPLLEASPQTAATPLANRREPIAEWSHWILAGQEEAVRANDARCVVI